jgi:16S rRNA (cytosine967-C5)-methyltransferase
MIRLGVKAARVVCHAWKGGDIPKEIAAIAPFDRILIDAPCTNTGVMRRRVDVKWRLRPVDFARMQRQQVEIARSVCSLLKPDGVLVYSTCSLEPEENEHVVEQLLIEFPRLRLTEKRDSRPFRDQIDGTFAARLIGGKTP